MNNKVSRKSFIKRCSAAMGLIAVDLPQFFAGTQAEPSSFYTANSENYQENASTLRGSWVRYGQAEAGDIPLQGCEIIVADEENTAVKQAAKFLAADIENISGYRPPINRQAAQGKTCIRLITIGNGELPATVPTGDLTGKWEAFRVITNDNTVYLIGSDFRGTAYAAYTLSERLGIDPLYLWTGFRPRHNENLVLKKTDFYAPPPTIKYRGFFHDDEDVLPRPFDRYGYPLRIGDVPLEWYQRFFETALRLRMNMVAPYVRVHRRYEVQKCASDWGLFYTSHHYDILLSNPFGIERFFLAKRRGVSTDWDWFKSKGNMIKYWRGGVEENKDIQAIWPVGLRGTDDHAYEFPKGTSEKEQAKVFREAIDAQVKTVKDVASSIQAPVFHFTLYTEMLDKFRNHPEDFDIPEDVILVWPDDNDGIMRGLPDNPGKWKHGVYYHLAYFGGKPTKQGPHVISPYRVAGQFKDIIHAGATEFLLVNVSELREHVMEARMIANIASNANEALQPDNPAEAYIRWWANEYFGPAVQEVVLAYRNYYDLISRSEQVYYGSVMVESVLEKLYKKLNGQSYTRPEPENIAMLKTREAKYRKTFELIDSIYRKLNLQQKQFFFEHVAFGLLVDYRPTQAAQVLIQALLAPDKKSTWDFIMAAMPPLEQLETEILRAERPPFEQWYRETWIKSSGSPFNLHRPYNQLRRFITSGGTESPIIARPRIGHNIEGAKLWTTYLEESERIKATY
ncbi:hypothetical protein FW774_07500 [Pedobacter sp. BS3]|uniref:glycosyl hydrolase 115 family protein n=1 Tax=Pedobacter sp. BS3 TaxID=2567937 RepID=UPI0011EC2105|nr:glycosyl hydrolase 115 family protein [Pedobacter sp. BS3]TZF84815.1 hypothetical protein FW774_07500 [Pedobacter sp. BS3]